MQNKFVRNLSFVCVLSAAGMGSAALAQSTTQGAIGGTVFDTTDAVVANADITIHNNGTNADVHLKTDGSGFFKAPLLEPGVYTLTVSAAGFSGYKSESVTVQVGQQTTLQPHLATGGESEVISVTAETPQLNFDSPDFSSVLNKMAIESVPINNRRWSSLAMTTPGVVSDSSGFGLISVHGISTILNNVLIDGADDNQAYYAEERGRTREAYSTSASAVREFAVNTGVYQAEYGRAAGAVINSVTTSGTNRLHGEAYFYDRQSKWNAFNDYARLTTLTSGVATSAPLKPKDLRKIYGFTVGGPIIKDKLFFTYTFDEHAHIFPGIAIPANAATLFAAPDATAVCNATTGLGTTSTLDNEVCTLAARQGITYANAVTAYNSALAALNTDLGTVPRTGYQVINTPKLDWQLGSKNHVSLLYHRLRWDSPGGVQTSPTASYGLDTFGNDFVKLDYGVAKLSTLVSSHISNEVLYQYGRELNDESQQPYSAYTKANLFGNGGTNVPEVLMDTSAGFTLGSPYYSYRKALPDERKWQVGDILYDTVGNHTFKFGVDLVHNSDLINNTYESNGVFQYNYISNYVNDLLNKQNGKTGNNCNSSALDATTAAASGLGVYPCYADLYQGFGNPVFAVTSMDYGAFAQDNWKITPRLTLELGIRYDYEALPSPVANLTTATGTFVPYAQLTNHPSDKNNFGPRIGFSWDPFGKGSTVVRGGYGIFYGRVTNGNLLNVLLNTGSPNGQYTTTFKPNTAGATQFPNIVGTGGIAPTPSSYFLANNLQNPAVHEYDLIVQQDLGKGNVFAVSYLGALGRELPNFLDLNLNPTTTATTITIADTTGKGPLPNGTKFVVPTYTAYGNTALFGAAATSYQAITELTSNINSSYNAVVFEVKNTTLKMVQFDANYTWSHALDYNQAANTTTTGNNWYDPYSNPRANYGNSIYNVPNRFVGYALFSVPGTRVNRYVDYVTNNWKINDSFQMQSGLPYSLTVSGFAGAGILSYWNGASGATFIPQLGRNTYKLPRKIVDDLRVQRDFPIKEGISLQLLANVFNVAGHQNVDGIGTLGYKLTAPSSTTGTATFQNTTFNVPTSSNNSGFLYTPRQFEIAAKVTF